MYCKYKNIHLLILKTLKIILLIFFVETVMHFFFKFRALSFCNAHRGISWSKLCHCR